MTLWLERKEKILCHAFYLDWREKPLPTLKSHPLHIRMTKLPMACTVSFDNLADFHSAYDIHNALSKFIAKSNTSILSGARLEFTASEVILCFNKLPVFYKIQFFNPNLQEWLECDDVQDVAHAKPAQSNPQKQSIPARFDMVLVNCGDGESFGVAGKSSPLCTSFSLF